MKKIIMFTKCFVILFVVTAVFSTSVWAERPKSYEISFTELESYKGWMDDPAPFYKNTDYLKKLMPPEVWEMVTFDEEKMKKAWAEIVGFKAPDVVGKVAPEIKPGKYTYKDKEKYPFEKLMWPLMYERFNPPGASGKNHVGNFTEIEIVPTRQYYYPLPVSEATVKNLGKTRLDGAGYLIDDTYISGVPFPRPSGEFMAQQIMYNWVQRYIYSETYLYYGHMLGVNKHWKIDNDSTGTTKFFKIRGRCVQPPLGWYDERAEREGEREIMVSQNYTPRDVYGTVIHITVYDDPDKLDDLFLLYIAQMRRIRRMSSSDKQETNAGQDATFDDNSVFTQKLTPHRFPYTFEVIGEGEFLVPITIDGEPYIDSKDHFSYKLLTFERRPIWIVRLNQQDPNYCYKTRVLYFDKETLIPYELQNYDWKDRLWRTWTNHWSFVPPMGQFQMNDYLTLDHIDTHSSWSYGRAYPAEWMTRKDINIGSLIKMQK